MTTPRDGSSDLPGPLASVRPQVPPRALVLSFAALAVPIYASLDAPAAAAEVELLLWLLALVPAFLLAYYRGWRGAAAALVIGMGVLSLCQVASQLSGRSVENWPLLLTVVVAYIGITLALGWVTELLHRERSRAESLALTDPLTELPNRRHVELVLEREFAAAQRGRPLAVVLFDLDHFKAFNDRYGHQAGDEALREFAAILQRTTRQMNLAGRLGGEEFLAVLSDTDEAGAVAYAERVRSALRARPGLPDELTFSAGVAEFSPSLTDVTELLTRADRALYAAKAAGRDRVTVGARPLLQTR